eukprot:scaffold744_cov111-Isochrysis_galbana.AAC.4
MKRHAINALWKITDGRSNSSCNLGRCLARHISLMNPDLDAETGSRAPVNGLVERVSGREWAVSGSDRPEGLSTGIL